jgi:hypothetical protein
MNYRACTIPYGSSWPSFPVTGSGMLDLQALAALPTRTSVSAGGVAGAVRALYVGSLFYAGVKVGKPMYTANASVLRRLRYLVVCIPLQAATSLR